MKVILFRGLAGRVFSAGLDTLAKRINNMSGYEAIVYDYSSWKKVNKLLDKENKPYCLVGHSLGARSAVKLSNKREFDNNLKFVYCLDYVHNLFGKNDLRANATTPTFHMMSRDGRVRKLQNADNQFYRGFSHIEMDDDKLTHDLIIEKMECYAN